MILIKPKIDDNGESWCSLSCPIHGTGGYGICDYAVRGIMETDMLCYPSIRRERDELRAELALSGAECARILALLEPVIKARDEAQAQLEALREKIRALEAWAE